jgi:uncharacterized protein (DUF488 family)
MASKSDKTAAQATRDGPRVWTIGYEKLGPDSLIAELEAEGIERVLDVRFRPQSRKPGMSKTRLSDALARHRIAYEHRKDLGTPPDLRWLFHAGRTARAAAAYREYVESNARPALEELAAELGEGGPRTVLLCLEEDPAACHRRVITEALGDRLADLEVVDL